VLKSNSKNNPRITVGIFPSDQRGLIISCPSLDEGDANQLRHFATVYRCSVANQLRHFASLSPENLSSPGYNRDDS